MNSGLIIPDLVASDKTEAITKLVSGLFPNDYQDVLESVLERERMMSTYSGHGTSLPHAKTVKVDGLTYAFAKSNDGIVWDDEKVNFIVLTLSPKGQSGPHVIFLSEIAKLLSNQEVRNELMYASSEDEIREVLELL